MSATDVAQQRAAAGAAERRTGGGAADTPAAASPSSPGGGSGSRRNGAGERTRGRLLDVAERLFAGRGVDAVPVRDITEAAGANTAAVHYHFGSKRGLVAAILERRAGHLGRRREQLLDQLDQTERTELRTVVEAMVLPTAEMVADEHGGRHYVAFLASLGDDPELMPMVFEAYGDFTGRYLETLARVLPDLPEDVRLFRFAAAKNLVNHVLGHPNGQVHLWLRHLSPTAEQDLADKLVDVVVGIFRAPVTTR